MKTIEAIARRYFPELSEGQWEQLCGYGELLREWNAKINLVSRKDMDILESRHLIHGMAMGKVCGFRAGARVLDVGTGGGIPGVILAIMFPESDFLLVDSIGKKVKAVGDMVERLGLKNTGVRQARVEELKIYCDFVVGRAVTALPKFAGWVEGKIRKGSGRGALDNGILYLKGGDFSEELKEWGREPTGVYPLDEVLGGDFETDKCVIYVKKR